MEIITSICLHLGQTRIFRGQQDWAKVAPIGGPKLPHGVLRKKSQKKTHIGIFPFGYSERRLKLQKI